MDLEDDIAGKYQLRNNKDQLYSSAYARRSFEERAAKIREILTKHRKQDHTILEIGAGHGDNVPVLHGAGFEWHNIFLNELLPERLHNIRSRYPQTTVIAGNALDADFKQQFNVVFQSTVFTSIISQELRQKLAQKMWELLLPGGIILWYDFIFNNPSNKDVRAVTVRETRQLFPDSVGAEINRITLAPPIGRRVGNLYPLFNLPFLRSHILAVFQKAA